jgi:transposase
MPAHRIRSVDAKRSQRDAGHHDRAVAIRTGEEDDDRKPTAPPVPSDFQVRKRRWVVERTFGWLGRYRRLSKDYEQRIESSEALIRIALIHLMLRRLSRTNAW